DVAFETGSDEMTSQLAELEARELFQIERALERLKQGTYGVCEGEDDEGQPCGEKIPVARLNALPYTTLCIKCQREMEKNPGWAGAGQQGKGEKVLEVEKRTGAQRGVDRAEREVALSSNRKAPPRPEPREEACAKPADVVRGLFAFCAAPPPSPPHPAGPFS